MLQGRELAQAVLDQVLLQPSTHHQVILWETSRDADCGTVGCLAGWTIMLASDLYQSNALFDWVREYADANGTESGTVDVALHLLGIDPDDRGEFCAEVFLQVNRTAAIKAFQRMTGV